MKHMTRDSKGRFCKCGPKLDEYSYVAGFKAFDSDLMCRNKQYKEGETFTEDEAIMCSKGMHYCINPFDVFSYYNLFDPKAGIIRVANVTGKVRYCDIVKKLGLSYSDSKVVTTELRIDKVWNVLDYLRLYASRSLQHSCISYYDIGCSTHILDGDGISNYIVVDSRETFVLHNASKQLLTNATKNFLGMYEGTIYCAKRSSLLDFTGHACEFAGIDGVHYRLQDSNGKILYEGHIGNDGDLLPNTLYSFDAHKRELTIAGEVGATHL